MFSNNVLFQPHTIQTKNIIYWHSENLNIYSLLSVLPTVVMTVYENQNYKGKWINWFNNPEHNS